MLLLGGRLQPLDLGAQRRAVDAAAQHAQAPRRLIQKAVEALQRHVPIWSGQARGEVSFLRKRKLQMEAWEVAQAVDRPS